MSTPAKIYQFPTGGPAGSVNVTTTGTTADVRHQSQNNFRVSTNTGQKHPQQRITIDELYSESATLSPELTVALGLLAQGLTDLDEALKTIQDGNQIAADDATQRFQAILPELFNCRTLSDSFGAMINAVLSALENKRGMPLTEDQIRAVRLSLYRLRSEPFMRFDSAVEEIMKLEEAGLIVEPLGFDALSDWLDD